MAGQDQSLPAGSTSGTRNMAIQDLSLVNGSSADQERNTVYLDQSLVP